MSSHSSQGSLPSRVQVVAPCDERETSRWSSAGLEGTNHQQCSGWTFRQEMIYGHLLDPADVFVLIVIQSQ
jgi:hypothetical protein